VSVSPPGAGGAGRGGAEWADRAAGHGGMDQADLVSWFIRGLRRLKRRLQNGIPLPAFRGTG